MPALRVALVCDTMSAYGGAERVIEQILKLYPEADVFCVVNVVPPEQQGFLADRPVTSTFLQKIPKIAKYYRKLLHLWPLAVEQLDVMAYDLVISTHHSVAYGVLTRPGQVHVSYVFSPARYAWDLQHEYLREAGLDRGILSYVARHTLHKTRLWDLAAAQRPDAMAACSGFVSERIWRVHRRRVEVIYPPVPPVAMPTYLGRGDYYISVGRLVPYKRTELLVRAFADMPDRKLKIIGSGPDLKKVQAAAGPNVQVLGFCSNEEVRAQLAGARAYMFAGVEDFGITAVESQALGTPVIAFADGGLRETVRTGAPGIATGLFFNEQSVPAIVQAVDEFERRIDDFTPAACIGNAKSFSEDAFRTGFQNMVQRALAAERRSAQRFDSMSSPSAELADIDLSA